MKEIKITWFDDDYTFTRINGTEIEIEKYYLNSHFERGDVKKIEFYNEKGKVYKVVNR